MQQYFIVREALKKGKEVNLFIRQTNLSIKTCNIFVKWIFGRQKLEFEAL